MNPDAEYISPDGLLRFIVKEDDGDVTLGFAGHFWHTHADVLAATSGAAEQEAVARFVGDLLADRSVIAVTRVGGEVRDVRITDAPVSELRDKTEEEEIELRYWSGRPWRG